MRFYHKTFLHPIVKPANIDEADYTIDKSRFDPRKWLIHSEKAMQNAVEELVQITGSAGKSILL